jgi:hypothetical protein
MNSNSQKPVMTNGVVNSTGQGVNSSNGSIKDQNQVQTQNQGVEQKLQVQTENKQGTESENGTTKNIDKLDKGNVSEKLTQVRSSVAQQVQTLLSTQSAAGGIGDQVREWARTQQQSETRIQAFLTKVESKTGLVRSLFGPDYNALNDLKKELDQNRVRLQQLEQLKLKLTSQGDIASVQEMISLLQQENTALQDRLHIEENDGGLVGWLSYLQSNFNRANCKTKISRFSAGYLLIEVSVTA